MRKTELLAPAGDMTCFRAALAAGADAIYIGGQQFGARAYAGNFSREEILEALSLAHFWGKKVYLTVNTLLKESELAQVVPYLRPLYEAGLDGIIVQDAGVFALCREQLPGLALHASTQLTVTESGAALFLKEQGVERIVPARELSLQEIIQLKEETGLEIETFIHGALCYAYSGQCLFSSLLGGRSGNRGRCAQPCRQPYQISENGRALTKKEQYPLSLKDLCVLPSLPALLEAGIDSLKIEGRMKSPEYVAGVTAMYRKYIDLYERCPDKWQVAPKDMELLSRLYVRSEISGGYYEKHNGREMVTLDRPGYAGCPEEVLEQIRKEYLQAEMARPVQLEIWLQEGQPCRLTASCQLEENLTVSASCQGMTVSPAQKKPLTKEDVEKQLKKTGGSGFAAADIKIHLEGALFLPVSALNDLRRQTLEQLKEKVIFSYAPVRTHAAQKISAANETGAAGQIAGPCTDAANSVARISQQTSGCPAADQRKAPVINQLRVSALSRLQALEALQHEKVGRLYLSADAVLMEADLWQGTEKDRCSVQEFLEALRQRKARGDFSFYLSLPVILRSYSEAYTQELSDWLAVYGDLVDGIQAGSLSGLALLKRIGWEKETALQHTAYVWNAASLSYYERLHSIDTYTAPLELNRKELFSLPTERMEMMVYGRIPMMSSAGCVKKTAGSCRIGHDLKSLEKGLPRRQMDVTLSDRYRVQFPVLTNCRHCMNTIYNSVPLSLHAYLDELRQERLQGLRLDMTTETRSETADILRMFAGDCGMQTKKGRLPAQADFAFTTGHYKKGAQ